MPIGRWVLREGCRQAVALPGSCPSEPPLSMSVNLSVKQLQHSDIVADVRDALDESGPGARALTLEITETVMMTDTDLAVQRLEELKELGVRLAMDDFGTGYSSLSYLSRFPVDILKMDRSFLRDGRLAGGLGPRRGGRRARRARSTCEVVAEGIELAEQWTTLRDLGCDLGQGFLFARPMDADATLDFLRSQELPSRRRRPSRPGTMQHSYEGLDRPGGFSRVKLLAPLRHRDFRLLWSGMCISLLGDGIFLVAMAWQVYALSNAPTALSLVGIAMTVPTIVLLLLGGVVSDRLDRRRVMLVADVARGLAVGMLAVLSLTGRIELWHVVALVAVYGAGAAFFGPAFDAIVPDVLPAEELAQANSLDQFVRPIALRLAGPALGGVLIDAGRRRRRLRARRRSFAVSARRAAVPAHAPRPRQAPARLGGRRHPHRLPLRAQPRLAVGHVRRPPRSPTCCSWARPRCCCPTSSRTTSAAARPSSALVFAAGGIGSVGCAVVLGQRGLPRRDITFMYVAWTLATFAVAGYGIATAVWQLMLASLAFNALETAGTIVWATTKQRHVPPSLLGRVSSLDWLISIGLLPLSFALTGPVSARDRRADDAHRRRRCSAASSRSPRCSCRACARSRAAPRAGPTRPTATVPCRCPPAPRA